MKLLYDYFPIICFFVAYKLWGIYVATAVTMAASFLQVGLYWLMHRRFEKVHLMTMVLIFLLGGSTLIFHNIIFIKWKPSIIYWLFSVLLIGSHYFGKSTLIHRMLGDKIKLPQKVWARVNASWGIFFFLMGFANLYVVYNYSTSTWVNFKLFGTLGLTIVFILLQVVYMSRHMELDKKPQEK